MNLANRAYREKRSFIRMQVNAPATVECISSTLTLETNQLSGTCRNISGGGMLLEINKVLPVSSQLNVTVFSRHNHQPILQVKAEVVRVDSGPENHCLLGLKILQPDPPPSGV
ncbi:PilZ domain-containing protein [Aestuariicella hydrocarbonica]|uniref:PilZ domain-containing protein n=1 Tax=Pseudomaricurvus hydrocarbonicus TaxID=1470433 RepID=A0A9E5JQC6_9GAMM|nr:PilZ domain-containing protein [Aestuariicella hydrocarbonica]NHO64722.1 PilZ domain-containing protein [Aestuariicella hydrocarbonica]